MGENVKSKAILYIQEYIIAHDLKPGDRLPPERILSMETGINRTTLRFAIQELSGRGLLIAKQGSGTYVNNLPSQQQNSETDKAEPDKPSLLEFLKILEVESAGLAANRANMEDLTAMHNILKDISLAPSSQEKYALMLRFMKSVVEASKNIYMLQALFRLIDHFEKDPAVFGSYTSNTVRYMDALLTAIELRNDITARQIMLKVFESLFFDQMAMT